MCVESVCRVVEVLDKDDTIALVEADDGVRRVSLALLVLEGVEVRTGDWLLTHTGLALRVLEDAEAGQLQEERRTMLAALDEGMR